MPKEQYREANVAKKISHVTFTVESSEDMQEQAHLQVVSNRLYNQDLNRTPVTYGLLDQRLGTSQKDKSCETCGKMVNECAGHFGYLNLELPVFHVGYFRSIISILQCICKRCAHVLLPETEKEKYMSRLINPNLSYLVKKSIRKIIIEKCKKVKVCTNCKDVNGVVKKLVGSKIGDPEAILNIVHDKYHGQKGGLAQKCLDEFKKAVEKNSELSLLVTNLVLSETLTPIDVLALFKRIPICDIPLLSMNPTRSHPKDLLLTRMLVPPVCVRPSIVSQLKSGTNEDDLTMLQSRIIEENRNIQVCKSSGLPCSLYKEKWNCLQLCTALYFNSELSGIPQMMKQKSSRGIIQRLKGKQGRFRGNLSGKRVDFSSRTVISPDPNLEIDQVGVPIEIARTLTFPERVTNINIHVMRELVINGPDNWPGANYVILQSQRSRRYLKYGDRRKLAQELKEGDIIDRHLRDNDVVLFNRQPSLHRISIMAHRVKVHMNRTFRFNECVCNPYNADFDGDEMNLHLPQTLEAKAEALEIMGVKHNLVTPKNGELLIAPTQDFLTGCYLLTKKDTFYDVAQINQLIGTMLVGEDANLHISLPMPAIVKPKKLWTGKQVFGLLLRPNKFCPVKANLEVKGKSYTRNREFCNQDSYVIIRNSELLAGTLDKSHVGSGGKSGNIFYIILRDFKADYAAKSMWRVGRLTSYLLMNTGFSIGISDVTPGTVLIKRRNDLLDEGNRVCNQYIQDKLENKLNCQPGCSEEETLESLMLSTLSDIRDNAGKVCVNELHPTNSPLIMALCGSKGSNINISQMIACVGQQALNGQRVPDSFDHRSLPHVRLNSRTPAAKGFVKNSFYSGLEPTEFFFHTMGGREGLVDTAVKTAETGYMQRRLIKALEDLVIDYDRTVRDEEGHIVRTVSNADGHIVQMLYGCDGLDPSFMESKDSPVDFNRILQLVRAQFPYRDEDVLDANQIRRATKKFFSEGLPECPSDFKEKLINFTEGVANRVEQTTKRYGNLKVVKEIERLTCSQLVSFFETCGRKFVNSYIEPGTAVGALAAQSIGEPGTQMTLKTFHFAGVASMNITQGVPRIKEIINATKSISTPIIRAKLTDPWNELFARKVKARIERTPLGSVSQICAVFMRKGACIQIKLNSNIIQLLKLEINADTVLESLLKSKLKLQYNNIVIDDRDETGNTLLIFPNVAKLVNPAINFIISEMAEKLPHVIIKGIPTVNRTIIARETKNNKPYHYLCVEGSNLREVIATYGVDGCKATSNNIIEVYETLGIEAARITIMQEIEGVMKSHGMSVDYRHIMLLAALMTHTGQVLGITRDGLAKMKQSVFNLASFERTADHLFDAAYYGQIDKINGVSENIIMGMQTPIGTGRFKLLHKPLHTENNLTTTPLLFDNAVRKC